MNTHVRTPEDDSILRSLAKFGEISYRKPKQKEEISSIYSNSYKKTARIRRLTSREIGVSAVRIIELNTAKNKKLRKLRPSGPIQLFNTILRTWRLDESDAIALLGLDPSDQGYAHDLLIGRKAVKGRDVEDRLAYLIQIRMTLSGWFRDEAVENEWLREPQKLLDGKVPMDLLLEGSMENLLLVQEYVQAATGW